jgi:hypothetical protein
MRGWANGKPSVKASQQILWEKSSGILGILRWNAIGKAAM